MGGYSTIISITEILSGQSLIYPYTYALRISNYFSKEPIASTGLVSWHFYKINLNTYLGITLAKYFCKFFLEKFGRRYWT